MSPISVDWRRLAPVLVPSSVRLDNAPGRLVVDGVGRWVNGGQRLFDIPTDEDGLIRHYSLSSADRLEIGHRRREHNQLGFAVQLCLMRYPGRVLATDETPPRAMLKYVAEQIGADAGKFALYARREETRRDHIARLMVYLAARSATGQDRRVALAGI